MSSTVAQGKGDASLPEMRGKETPNVSLKRGDDLGKRSSVFQRKRKKGRKNLLIGGGSYPKKKGRSEKKTTERECIYFS